VAGQFRGQRTRRVGIGRLRASARATLLAAIAALAPVAGPAADSLVWALRGARNTVYLAGSIHVLRPDGAPLPEPIERAYRDAESLVMEVDLDDLDPLAGARFTAAHGVYGADRSLRVTLGEERWSALDALASRLGLASQMLERFEPWAAALLLSATQLQQAGLSVEAGVEQQLAARAASDGKPIAGLETIEQQLGLFDALPEPEQTRFLELTLAEASTLVEQIDAIEAAWRNGSLSQLEALLARDYARFPELFDALVERRNRAWIPTLRRLLEGNEDVLVVVGALHLVGEASVPALLRAAGFEPVRLGAR
jgi:uncharacterized protein YbaP (TraB family)